MKSDSVKSGAKKPRKDDLRLRRIARGGTMPQIVAIKDSAPQKQRVPIKFCSLVIIDHKKR